MKCKYCKYDFCWACLKEFLPGKTHNDFYKCEKDSLAEREKRLAAK